MRYNAISKYACNDKPRVNNITKINAMWWGLLHVTHQTWGIFRKKFVAGIFVLGNSRVITVVLLTGVRPSPADRARMEGCLGFAGARRPQRANKRRERGSEREDSRGPRARRSSGHVAAVKSHLIPWRGRPRACARGVGLIERGWPELGARLRRQWRTAERRRGRCCWSHGEEEEREERGTEWRIGARGAVPTGLSRSAAARPRRRRTAATWPAPGGARRAPRAGERGEGKRAALSGWAEREAGRPSSACPLFFFLNFFSPKSLNKTFDAFTNLFRGWSEKKNCSS